MSISMKQKAAALRKFVDNDKLSAAVAEHSKGGVVGGLVTLVKEPTIEEYLKELKSVCAADGNPQDKNIDKSVINGLLMGVGEFFASTTIVNVGGKDMTGAEWFLSKYRKSRFAQFGSLMDAAIKAKSIKLVRRGVEYQIPKSFASTGHRGRAKINLGDIFGTV